MTHVDLLFFLPVACERQGIKTYLESVTFYLVCFPYVWLFGLIFYGLRKIGAGTNVFSIFLAIAAAVSLYYK